MNFERHSTQLFPEPLLSPEAIHLNCVQKPAINSYMITQTQASVDTIAGQDRDTSRHHGTAHITAATLQCLGLSCPQPQVQSQWSFGATEQSLCKEHSLLGTSATLVLEVLEPKALVGYFERIQFPVRYSRHLASGSLSFPMAENNTSPWKEMRCYQGKDSETMNSNPMENDWTMNPIYKNQFLKPLVVHYSLSPAWSYMTLQTLHYFCTKNYLPYLKMNTWNPTKSFDGINIFKFYFSLVYTVTEPPPSIFCDVFFSSLSLHSSVAILGWGRSKKDLEGAQAILAYHSLGSGGLQG